MSTLEERAARRAERRAARNRRLQDRAEAQSSRVYESREQRKQQVAQLSAEIDADASLSHLAPQQRTQMKVLRHEQAAQESLQRSLAMARAAESDGAQSLRQLRHQREQIDDVGRSLDEANASLEHSEKTLKNMKGFFTSLFRKNKPRSEAERAAAREKDGVASGRITDAHDRQIDDALIRQQKNSERQGASVDASLQRRIDTLRSGQQTEFDENQTQQAGNEMLDELHGSVRRLGDMARLMNTEMQAHNEGLEEIDERATEAEARIESNTRRMRRLMR
ncbi:MAG: hypothetical protein MHM6MM_002502 [Cercozoa sp. M6MM]